jgi:hypothetical protein
VSITNGVGTGASTGIFKVRPQITSFTPDTAVGGSGTVIEVTGTALRAGTGEPTVKVGTTTVPPSAIVQSTPTLLRFTAPLGAATGKISVTTAGGTAASETNLTVVQPPRATSFAPTAGPAGTLVKITGTNLAGATAVTFSGADPVTPSNVTSTSLQVVVPPDAVTGPVSVTNPVGTTTSVPTFKLLPKITGLPSEAPLGSVVVVSGTNLKTGGAHPVVKVGTVVAAVVDSSPTEVSFTVPPLAVTGKITITTVDGTATSPTALIVMPGSVGI